MSMVGMSGGGYGQGVGTPCYWHLLVATACTASKQAVCVLLESILVTIIISSENVVNGSIGILPMITYTMSAVTISAYIHPLSHLWTKIPMMETKQKFCSIARMLHAKNVQEILTSSASFKCRINRSIVVKTKSAQMSNQSDLRFYTGSYLQGIHLKQTPVYNELPTGNSWHWYKC